MAFWDMRMRRRRKVMCSGLLLSVVLRVLGVTEDRRARVRPLLRRNSPAPPQDETDARNQGKRLERLLRLYYLRPVRPLSDGEGAGLGRVAEVKTRPLLHTSLPPSLRPPPTSRFLNASVFSPPRYIIAVEKKRRRGGRRRR